MASYPNRYYHGWCSNDGNPKSHFKHYIIETAHDVPDLEHGTIIETVTRMEDYYFHDEREGEPYYIIYGILKSEWKQHTKFIAASDRLKQAIEIVEHLTGNTMIESDVPVFK